MQTGDGAGPVVKQHLAFGRLSTFEHFPERIGKLGTGDQVLHPVGQAAGCDDDNIRGGGRDLFLTGKAVIGDGNA